MGILSGHLVIKGSTNYMPTWGTREMLETAFKDHAFRLVCRTKSKLSGEGQQ